MCVECFELELEENGGNITLLEAFAAGEASGYDDGNEEGYREGYDEGYSAGLSVGARAALDAAAVTETGPESVVPTTTCWCGDPDCSSFTDDEPLGEGAYVVTTDNLLATLNIWAPQVEDELGELDESVTSLAESLYALTGVTSDLADIVQTIKSETDADAVALDGVINSVQSIAEDLDALRTEFRLHQVGLEGLAVPA